MKVTVTLYNHYKSEKEVTLNAKNYNEFKKEFPKHFGNMIYYASNKAQNEVNTIKQIIKNSNSFEEFQEKLRRTRWKIKIKL